jgi:lysophospholipase L1-like esterase
MKKYTFLALGDSYTIGEQVRIVDNFPYQTVQLLREHALEKNAAWSIHAPEIVAVTGYTTDELSSLINTTILPSTYDFVTLLIGVNNQYRNMSVDEFSNDFQQLLTEAIRFAGGKSNRTFVLSIPDWGVTPFAENRNRLEIAAAIDSFNAVCRHHAQSQGAHYIDITASQRLDCAKEDFLAWDKLHPSAKEYRKWAEQLSPLILQQIDHDLAAKAAR